ncbi:MAG: hypothetical protein ACRC57_13955 [Sarcina sp.]
MKKRVLLGITLCLAGISFDYSTAYFSDKLELQQNIVSIGNLVEENVENEEIENQEEVEEIQGEDILSDEVENLESEQVENVENDVIQNDENIDNSTQNIDEQLQDTTEENSVENEFVPID